MEETDAPPSAVSDLEKWNHPRHNVARLMAIFWSFVVSGANDAAYGGMASYTKLSEGHC